MSRLHEQAALGTGIDERAQAAEEAAYERTLSVAHQLTDDLARLQATLQDAVALGDSFIIGEWHERIPDEASVDDRMHLRRAWEAACAAMIELENAQKSLTAAAYRLTHIG